VRSIVVVGAGLAASVPLSRSARTAHRTLTIIGDEVHQPYDRPPLSKQLLSGIYTRDQCMLPAKSRT